MKISELTVQKCNVALDHAEGARINLAGMPDNAAARIRVFISKFNKDYRVKLATTLDRNKNVLHIFRHTDKPAKTKNALVEVPECLFYFLNKEVVSADQMAEILAFRAVLNSLCDNVELLLKDEDIIPENLI